MDFMFIFSSVIIPAIIILGAVVYASSRYKRCSSNQILVVFGKVGSEKTSKCLHGGGTFIVPLFQDYGYLDLSPFALEIPLKGALAKNNIRVNVPSTFTIAISTDPEIIQTAAERLFGSTKPQIAELARDIIIGQMRMVVANLQIEEINGDREKFLHMVDNNVTSELRKVGLSLINVNIHDITDESGYIQAIGKNAAAAAIQKAKIEVAEREKEGEIGIAHANQERMVTVAEKTRESIVGQQKAMTEQEVSLAELSRQKEIGQQTAEAEKQIKVSELQATAVKGKNDAQGKIAEYNAELAVKSAKAKQDGEVAQAEADTLILKAQREAELAKLSKTELVQEEINKAKVEVKAEAEAEKVRREAKGQADATLLKYEAEAAGIQKVMEAKAQGWERMRRAAGDDLLSLTMLEKAEVLIQSQLAAFEKVKIDKLVVWDSGKGGAGNFMKDLASAVPPIQDVLKAVGIDLKLNNTAIKEQKSNQSDETVQSVNAADLKPGKPVALGGTK